MINTTIPIDFEFAPEIEPVARAAYEAYHQGRVSQPWPQLRSDQRFRWLLMVDVVHDWPASTVTAQGLRDTYLTLIYAKSWQGLKREYRERWVRVRDAVVATRATGPQRRSDVPVDGPPAATLRDKLAARRQGMNE